MEKNLSVQEKFLNDTRTTCTTELLAKSYWLINANRKEAKRFIKNDKSTVGVFKYMFIYKGKIDGVIGKGKPVIITTVSVEIDLAREIYERLLSQGWRRTKLFEK